METSELTISNVYSVGWEKAKSKIGLLIGCVLILALISIGFSILSNIASVIGQNSGGSIAISSVGVLIALIVLVAQYGVNFLTSYGFTRVQLNVLDNKEAKAGQLFKAEGQYWRFVGANIAFGALIFAGILLLIIPGIYWALKYQFIFPLIVDKKLNVKDAFRESGQISHGHKWWLLGLWILLGLTNLVGALLLLVGLLVTIPLTVMIYIYVYRLLVDSKPAQKTPIKA